jgi:hypothetical protein
VSFLRRTQAFSSHTRILNPAGPQGRHGRDRRSRRAPLQVRAGDAAPPELCLPTSCTCLLERLAGGGCAPDDSAYLEVAIAIPCSLLLKLLSLPFPHAETMYRFTETCGPPARRHVNEDAEFGLWRPRFEPFVPAQEATLSSHSQPEPCV